MREEMSGPVLLLSIDEQHVSRIFSGDKKFELRKSLPRSDFSRVYLYQTRGEGVVGWFDPGEVIHLPVDELWSRVGTDATTRSRFFSYFRDFSNGYAIAVQDAGEFDRHIPASTIRRIYPRFRAPQSYHLLRVGHPIKEFLERCWWYDQEYDSLNIRLDRISKAATKRFRRLVLEEIGKHYDDIDDSFVDSIIETHEERHDPVGFFTESKEALTVKGERGKILGYTTITYKKGGSAKTGPTILLEEHRGQGVGQDVRVAVEMRILFRGYRKIYCTAPAVSPGVIRYLQKSDYRIEAQLSRQYTADHDEIVFGKLLLTDFPELFLESTDGSGRAARVVTPDSLSENVATHGIASLLRSAWFPFDDPSADRIAEEVGRPSDEPRRKPKDAVFLLSGAELVGTALLLPKRGGSVKMLVISSTNHTPSIKRLIKAACEHAESLGGRRTYVLHPVGDAKTIRLLRKRGFMPEGLLLAPYAPGQDLVVYGQEL